VYYSVNTPAQSANGAAKKHLPPWRQRTCGGITLLSVR
jgi:hypothetical protein